jgi:hypothetical protein
LRRCDAALTDCNDVEFSRAAARLFQLERGENVIVNLRLDTDVETEFVSFDRPRVVRVLERIAADLDNLSLVPDDPQADREVNQNDPQARRELAEPSREPTKLSQREQRTALRAGSDYRESKKTDCVFRKLNALCYFSVPLLPKPYP